MMNTIDWTKRDTAYFIELLRDQNCLWQVKHVDYRNKPLRDASLNNITAEMSKFIHGIKEDDIKKKINTLRSQYRREIRFLATSKKSGGEDVYSPKLWCFDQLQFLNEGEIQRESKSILYNTEEESGDKSHLMEEKGLNEEKDDTESTNATLEQMPETQVNASTSSQPGPNKKKFKKDDLSTKILTTMWDHFKEPKEQPDRYDLVGKTIACRLRGMDKHLALLTEKKINDALFDAEICQLHPPSDHCSSPTTFSSPTQSFILKEE